MGDLHVPPTEENTLAREMSQGTGVSEAREGVLNAQIQLEDALVDEIADWIQAQLYEALNSRSDMVTKINELARIYEAHPEEAVKSFPWEGACNLVVPVAATAVETVFTRITGSIFGSNDLYSGRSRSANWADAVDPMVNWLNWVNTNVFDSRDIYSKWILSGIKYGTAILKLPWVRRTREVRYMDASGSVVHEQIVLHDGPKPEWVPLEDFFWSPDAVATQDLQNCEWMAHRFRSTWKSLREAELSGDYFDVERIKEYQRSQFEDSETQIHQVTGYEPLEPTDYELYEVWASYPIDDEGNLAEIVVTMHLESRTVIRAVYNFYRHQERPFHAINFFPRENSLQGIGIIEMLRDVQEEITAIHRSRLDNATLANTKIYKRTQGARVAFEDVFPGAVFDVENADDLTTMDMGTPHTTLLNEEQHTHVIGERRTGVSDYTFGRESSAIGSRATATSTMALIREGNVRFQFFIREIRKALTNIGHQIISLYQQFAPDREVVFELFDEKGEHWFREVMQLPPEYSRANIVIDVRAMDDETNKEMKQQAYMMMMKVLQETYMQVGNAMMIVSNPEAPPAVKGLAEQGAKAASKLIERLLEAFDFKDAHMFSPNIEELLSMTAALEMGGQVADFLGGRQEGVGGPGVQPPMGTTGPGTQSAREPLTQQAGPRASGEGGLP